MRYLTYAQASPADHFSGVLGEFLSHRVFRRRLNGDGVRNERHPRFLFACQARSRQTCHPLTCMPCKPNLFAAAEQAKPKPHQRIGDVRAPGDDVNVELDIAWCRSISKAPTFWQIGESLERQGTKVPRRLRIR